MLTFIPCPHVLRVVTTAAVLVDRQLDPRAQASAILPATSLGLLPRRAVHAAAHALARATAHAECRVECPPKLRAAECRRLLEWRRWRRWRR